MKKDRIVPIDRSVSCSRKRNPQRKHGQSIELRTSVNLRSKNVVDQKVFAGRLCHFFQFYRGSHRTRGSRI